MKWSTWGIELAASVCTLIGMYLGSTTGLGAALYLASAVFFWVVVQERRLWGLVPLNAGVTVIAIINIRAAIATPGALAAFP